MSDDNLVFYCAKLSNDSYIGKIDDGTWLNVKDIVKNENQYVISVSLYSKNGTAYIDDNRKGYFLSNRCVTEVGSGKTIESVGLGYLDNDLRTIRIKWFSKPTLELLNTEARDISTSELFTIINP